MKFTMIFKLIKMKIKIKDLNRQAQGMNSEIKWEEALFKLVSLRTSLYFFNRKMINKTY